MVAVPSYGMDGLASDLDGLISSAEDALLAASVSKIRNNPKYRIVVILFDV